MESLIEQSLANRSAINSAVINYRHISQGASRIRNVDAAELDSLVQSRDFSKNPDEIDWLARQILLNPDQYDKLWGERKLTIESGRSRSEEGSLLFVDDGQHQISRGTFTSGYDQASIDGPLGGGGKIGRLELSDLLFDPSRLNLSPDAARKFDTEVLSGEDLPEITFSAHGSDGQGRLIVRVDSQSRPLSIAVMGADGSPSQVFLYGSYQEYEGGISFPHIACNATYQGGTISTLKISVVDHAQFNTEVDETEFQVAVRQGSPVLDFRENGDNRRVVKASTDDVLNTDFVTPGESSTKLDMASPSSGSSFFQRLLWINAAILIVALIVGFFVRRNMRSQMDGVSSS